MMEWEILGSGHLGTKRSPSVSGSQLNIICPEVSITYTFSNYILLNFRFIIWKRCVDSKFLDAF